MSEYELIIKKLEIVRDNEDESMYLCDKKHSKILLEGIDKYKQVIDKIKEYIKEWREDDGSGSYGTLELLELLEEIK